MTTLGLIGLGAIGQVHLKALTSMKDVHLKGVCDLNADRVEDAARAHNIELATTNPGELLNDKDIEGIVLALPAGVRSNLANAALKAGKHVLLEKPAATNVGELRKMESVRKNRILACCSARFSHYPAAVVAREFLREGRLRNLRSISCRAVAPPRKSAPADPPLWRLSRKLNGGGILVNWGPYDFDFLFSIAGFELNPLHALAQTWTVPPPNAAYAAPGSDAECHVNALVTFAGGIVLDYERAEFTAIPDELRWQITGEYGTLALILLPGPEQRLVWWRPDPENGTTEEILWEGDSSTIDSTAQVCANFAAAIRGECEPFSDLRKVLFIQTITDAIYESSETGAPVSIQQIETST